MKISVLVNNNTLIGKPFLSEHGLSFYIETDSKKILFDCGCSDIFLKNAKLMNIDASNITHIIFSHGHYDHTGGIKYLLPLLKNRPTLIAHPQLFCQKIYKEKSTGITITKKEAEKRCNIQLSKDPIWITDKLVFLGEIEQTNDFENKKPMGKVVCNNIEKDDYQLDDTALAYKSPNGLIIITGCSHSGICNIVSYAKKVCNENKIVDIIGGFHLVKTKKDYMQQIITFLKNENIDCIYPAHCTDLQAKAKLFQHFTVQEVGSGMLLQYDI